MTNILNWPDYNVVNNPDTQNMQIPHRHDKTWYEAQLARLPPAVRHKAQQGYKNAWQEAYRSEPVAHKKSNAARYAANTRLRNYLEKILG